MLNKYKDCKAFRNKIQCDFLLNLLVWCRNFYLVTSNDITREGKEEMLKNTMSNIVVEYLGMPSFHLKYPTIF